MRPPHRSRSRIRTPEPSAPSSVTPITESVPPFQIVPVRTYIVYTHLFSGSDDASGVRIRDLERWGGLMGDGHDYYERGNLDIFSGRGPCMRQAPCRMNLTSDGTGPHHGWYCNYLEATVTGPHLGCAQQLFTVEQWLATDASPYRLYAVVDNCNKAKDAAAADADEPRVTVL